MQKVFLRMQYWTIDSHREVLAMKDSLQTWHLIQSNREQKVFWESCGEDDCRVGGEDTKGRVDPVLKLYPNCPMMYTQNTDVLSGQANGSRVRFERLYLKHGESTFDLELKSGTIINAFYASQVHSIEVKHENRKMIPQVFRLEPSQRCFRARIDIDGELIWQAMRGTQFPIISNTATTGHKLQGATLDSLYVNGWYYRKNWVYVVLSRVRTMKGLFLLQPLLLDMEKYKQNENMVAMITKVKDEQSLPCIADNMYEEMEHFNEH